MGASDDYRHHALICLSMAAEASDPKAKASLLFMAGAWNKLADHADRNSALAQRPVVLQQQQIQPDKDEPEI
jgi:hypothetical protein